MCKYCGCQDVTAIGDLTREHDEVVGLMNKIRDTHTTSDIDATAAVARQIVDILAPHTTVAEEGHFPLLTHDFPDQITVLRAEYRHIEHVLAAAATGTPHRRPRILKKAPTRGTMPGWIRRCSPTAECGRRWRCRSVSRRGSARRQPR
jgi:hypothetical protein